MLKYKLVIFMLIFSTYQGIISATENEETANTGKRIYENRESDDSLLVKLKDVLPEICEEICLYLSKEDRDNLRESSTIYMNIIDCLWGNKRYYRAEIFTNQLLDILNKKTFGLIFDLSSFYNNSEKSFELKALYLIATHLCLITRPLILKIKACKEEEILKLFKCVTEELNYNLEHVKSLILSDTIISNDLIEFISEKTPCLTELNLENHTNRYGDYTNKSMVALSKLTNLRYLNLANFNNLSDINPIIFQQTLSSLTLLKELDVSCCYIDDPVLNAIGQLTYLTKLNLECNDYTSAGVENLKNLANLKKLYIENENFHLQDLTAIYELASLKTLYLGTSEDKDSAKAFKNLTNLSCLNRLILSNNHINFSEVGKLTNLEFLSICTRQEDIAPAAFESLTGLSHLNELILDMEFMNNSHLLSLNKLITLKILSISTLMKDIAPAALEALTGLSQLNELVLKMVFINNSHLPSLGKLTSLTKLVILQPKDLIIIDKEKYGLSCLENLSNLEKLEISRIPQDHLTNTGIDKLYEIFPDAIKVLTKIPINSEHVKYEHDYMFIS